MVVSIAPYCLSFAQQACHSNNISKHIALGNYARDTRRGCIRRPQILPSALGDAVGLRVFVLSDLHTDYSENMEWVKCLPTVRYKNDTLIVAGDVAETYNNFIVTMSVLKDRFEHVLYVPGNHDLWCRQEGEIHLDSHQKLKKLLDACRGLEVETSPMVLDGLGIIPLFSWYHESFDREEEITSIHIPSLEMACKDFKACKWSKELSNGDISLALYFDAMNEKNQSLIKEIQNTCSQIISFSHFVPRQELCPEKRMLFYPKLPKIIGSDCLEARIRSIHGVEGSPSACHVFGHTHFCWDSVIHGIRYVQAPLAYPRERKRRMNGGGNWLPFCIYSNGKFSERLSPCYWDYKELGWDVRVALAVYGSFSSKEYIKAQRIRNRQMQFHMNIFAHADVIVSPTTGVTAYSIFDDALQTGELDYINGAALVRYSIAGNFLGLPAVSVPVCMHARIISSLPYTTF